MTLSHRSESFSRAKFKNRDLAAAQSKAGRLKLYMQSSIKRIGHQDVELEHDGHQIRIRNDAVIVCVAGDVLPATIYTLIANAKLNDIDPQAWLADVLHRINDHAASRLNELLPWNWRAQPTTCAA